MDVIKAIKENKELIIFTIVVIITVILMILCQRLGIYPNYNPGCPNCPG